MKDELQTLNVIRQSSSSMDRQWLPPAYISLTVLLIIPAMMFGGVGMLFLPVLLFAAVVAAVRPRR